ncbi:MAG: hypothetical protein ABFD70_06645 [Syntrophaceae bacterium]
MKKPYRYLCITLALVLGVFLTGMSGTGTVSPNQGLVSSPYDAKIRDSSGNEVTISSVTFDGKTSFNAYLGKGKVQIPFENIARIEVKGDSICVKLSGAGTMCNLRINGVSKVYGKTPYGTYQVPLKDVVWIELTKPKQ